MLRRGETQNKLLGWKRLSKRNKLSLKYSLNNQSAVPVIHYTYKSLNEQWLCNKKNQIKQSK